MASHRIRFFRIEKGLTQAEFAQRMGVTPTTVWNWENGLRRASLDVLKRAAEILDVEQKLLLSEQFNTEGE